MRKYIDFHSKKSEIWENCNNELEEIFKEKVKENSEVRIDLSGYGEYGGIRMTDPDVNRFEFITSIACKREGDNVDITLYLNEYDEDNSDHMDFNFCGDVAALISVYEVVYDYFSDLED